MAWAAMLVGAAVSAYSSYKSASTQADASTQAAGVQTAAGDKAAALQYAAAQDTLAFQKQQWESAQTMAQPWVQAGQGAVSKLSGLMGIGGVSSGGWAPQKAVASSGSAGIPASSSAGPGIDWSRELYNYAPAPGTTTPGAGSDTGQILLPNADQTPRPRGMTLDMTALAGKSVEEKRAASNGTVNADGTWTKGPAAATPGSATVASDATTVQMKAPDGTVSGVPKEYVEYYKQLGAVVV